MTNAELESLLASERIARVEAERERDRWGEAASVERARLADATLARQRMREALEGARVCVSECTICDPVERARAVQIIDAALGAEPGDAALTQKEGQGAPAAGHADILRDILGLIESGELVRCTARDDEPDWAIRTMRTVMVLKRAQEAVNEVNAAKAAPSPSNSSPIAADKGEVK